MRWRLRRGYVRTLARRVAALFATLVLLVGIVRSGVRYFYCPMMGATMEDACCPSTHGENAASDAPAIDASDCCKAKRLGHLPSGAASTSVDLADSPLAYLLPSFDRARGAAPPRVDVMRAHDARAGPHSPARQRSSLMIWNC